ncbi:pro-sigmaK processing inhibitor BofA family protein [Acutalibacter caecimuris]|uniref:pro-sigmaK processing inhibitor BofA family protein n=1 Tax=Acutalibacter caecimuris TaxID=3093657 RepID=UPI002AC8F802|nr:pro-sigmaK processing inhibitor BofA family protein [Acutalibacter sp. M00118]
MKSFLFSACLGLTALALVNYTGTYTGVSIAVNRLSLAASGVLGVPGVTLLVLLNTILL